MSEIDASKIIDQNELDFKYIRADGPGGQNVNKVSTAVQLRFDVVNSASLPEYVKRRLIKLAGKRMNQDGILIIDARRYRTQEENREDVIRRLHELISQALKKPKKRKPTRPSRSSQEQRLKEKKRRGGIKQKRAKQFFEDE